MESSRKPSATLYSSTTFHASFFTPVLNILNREVEAYLNQNSTLDALGIDPSSPPHGNYMVVSEPVNAAFGKSMDVAHPTHFYVEHLLNRGIKVLIYVGATDWVCNWVGNLRWVNELEWGSPLHRERLGELREWGGFLGDDKEWTKIGITASGGQLTFATIDGAGHMVCFPRSSR